MVRKVINVFLTDFLIIDGYDATKIKRVVEIQTLRESVRNFEAALSPEQICKLDTKWSNLHV